MWMTPTKAGILVVNDQVQIWWKQQFRKEFFPYMLSSVGESDDASMTDADNISSRTEFDSHANMIVVGKHAHIINYTGRKANVQPYSPNYDPQQIPIVDAAVLYECP